MTPLAPGSVSLRLYPHDLPATEQVEVLRRQARRASEIGYDGVMVSEHHADFPGYLPNPVQLAGLLLDAMPTGWVAPCPMLFSSRRRATVPPTPSVTLVMNVAVLSMLEVVEICGDQAS